jgi:TRAP-type C4-dicarboxylate transport system substrate-binding protein
MISRRSFAVGALAAPAILSLSRGAYAGQKLKISHQFPGGSITEGDFRDRLCRQFAIALEKRTNGALGADVYPDSSLMKVNAQFSSMRKGALDMSFYPLAYAGGEVPELNITLMPCLVSSYTQGQAWKTAPIGKEIARICAEKGIVIVSWIWQAGGCASRGKSLLTVDDAKGMKVRGGSREVDLMFKEAGAAVVSLPSNEAYAAMQTGSVDAVVTSSTSLISFRMEELSKHLAGGGGKSYWFMFEPLLMSKAIFDALPKDQQTAIMDVGAEMEKFGYDAAMTDDKTVVDVFGKKGVEIHPFTDEVLGKWKEIARKSAWKDYSDKSANASSLMKLAIELAEKTA